jgi:hypothetical protein
MDCNEARQHWSVYHDSEGDPTLHLRISEHLEGCPDCAQWFSQQSRLEELLAETLRAGPATPELWDQVLSRSGLRRATAGRRWLWLASVAACAAAVAVLVGVRLWPANGRGSDLDTLAAAWHERLAAGDEPLQFRNDSDQAVETYLRKRVTFPVRCPPRKDAGFAVRGAGVGKLGQAPAAYLAGEVGDDPVSIFILPREGLEAFPRQSQAAGKKGTHHGRQGRYALVARVIDRNTVVVVGQTRPERLERVLNAYGTYPDHH